MATFLNTLKIIHLHPILIIFIIISLITGTFLHLFILLSIVFIHELGHFIVAKFFKWRIEAIVIWVFGGVMKTDEYGNRPIKEDVLVTIAGPIQHVFMYIFFLILLSVEFVPNALVQTAIYYNWLILFFNLLPIYPLDGGKLLFNMLSIWLPFRQAHRRTIFFSLIAAITIIVFQLIFLPFTLSALLIIIFLLIENKIEWKNQYYIFIRFLVQRYNEPVYYQIEKIRVSDSSRLMELFSRFRRNRTHHMYDWRGSKLLLTEHESLSLFFKKNKLNESIGEIMKEK